MTAFLAALATIAESIAAMASGSATANSHASRNPFESRAGLSDVITVHVVGPDGSVKESKSTNDSNNIQKGTRP